MIRDRCRIAAGDRSGERGLSPLQRVLQRRSGQRPDDALHDPARLVVDGLLAEQFPPLRAARNASSASASTVTMWLLAWASAAW